jgi:hypothetical protein
VLGVAVLNWLITVARFDDGLQCNFAVTGALYSVAR